MFPAPCRHALLAVFCGTAFRDCSSIVQLPLRPLCLPLCEQAIIECGAEIPLQCNASDPLLASAGVQLPLFPLVGWQLAPTVVVPCFQVASTSANGTVDEHVTVPVATCGRVPPAYNESVCCQRPFARNEDTGECGLACPLPTDDQETIAHGYTVAIFASWILAVVFSAPVIIFWFGVPARRHFPEHLPGIIVLIFFLLPCWSVWAFWVDGPTGGSWGCSDATHSKTTDDADCGAQGALIHWTTLSAGGLCVLMAMNLLRVVYQRELPGSSTRARRLIGFAFVAFVIALPALAFVVPCTVGDCYAATFGTPLCLAGTKVDDDGNTDSTLLIATWLAPLWVETGLWMLLGGWLVVKLWSIGGTTMLKQQGRLIGLIAYVLLQSLFFLVFTHADRIAKSQEIVDDVAAWAQCVALTADDPVAQQALCSDDITYINVAWAIATVVFVYLTPCLIALIVGLSDPLFWRWWQSIVTCKPLQLSTTSSFNSSKRSARSANSSHTSEDYVG
jgi:hypothetical protein